MWFMLKLRLLKAKCSCQANGEVEELENPWLWI
jgi:hypothetical protein